MEQPITIFLLLILAAVLHASWNAIIKSAPSGLISIALLNTFSAIVMIPALFIVELPAYEAWPYLLTSVIIHVIYCLTLVASYHFGDLSQVYPIARGSGPILVAIFSYLYLTEELTDSQWFGILTVSIGIMIISRAGIKRDSINGRAIIFALITGLLIASYTIIDGLGARVSRSPVGYSALLVIFFALPTLVIAFCKHGIDVILFAKRYYWSCTIAGIIATLGYTIVLYAMTKTQIAYAATVRETSVIFATLIGTLLLGESFGKRRIAASLVILLGVSWIHMR